MRKLMFVLLCLVVLVGLSAAQTYTGGVGLTGKDVLGAHNNGGRGCAGCHAPHSGGKGGGGNAATNAAAFSDPNSGNDALFGQDLTPLYGYTLAMGDAGRFVEVLPATMGEDDAEIRGIAMCLACHDGNVAKGGMMSGISWEKQYNLLPAGVYGPNAIPTLLGNDGSTAGNYYNDHPVGVNATLSAAHLVSASGFPGSTYLTVTFNGTTLNGIAPTAGSTYASFATNYGYPALAGTPWAWGVGNPTGNSDPGNLFVTCTTCHNQHVMYIYKAPSGKQAGSAIAGGVYPTYFFVNGPYNPGAGNADPTKAASTTQFCRQCHFSVSNEAFGVNSVTTAF